jgi:opacity protein-like surface antigen
MLKRIVAVTSCIAVLAGHAVSAQAADLDEIIYAPELPMTKPVEIGSGWYLRGDLGYSVETRGAATAYRVFNAGPPVSYGAGLFGATSLSSDWSGSAGVGYSFTDYLRSDLTFDYSTGTFGASAGFNCGGQCAGVNGQKYEQYAFMANAYADLGTFAGFTPYVGAGAGFSSVHWGPVNSTQRGDHDWRFTYALMTGLSYDLSNNMKLDLGYRYSKVNSGTQFYFNAANRALGATGGQADDNGIEKHEIRVGLRYELW